MEKQSLTLEVTDSISNKVPGSSQSSIYRLVVPMLYAAMGVSLGTLAGIYVAIKTAPDSSAAYNDSTQSSPADNESAAIPSASSTVSQNLPAPAVMRVPAGAAKLVSYPLHSVASHAAGISAEVVVPALKTHRSPAAKTAPYKLPINKRNSERRSAPSEERRAKPSAHPYVPSSRTALASAPEVLSEPLDEQLSYVGDSKTSSFYTEGDLTVADYDAKTGTIETSDGRTFAVGATVSISSATSWEDYRSDVHYRCGQNGSCTLIRAGAVAPNARLI